EATPEYAPARDRNDRELHPGDSVRFKLYPRGTATGVVVISERARQVLPDGSTLPALAIDSDGRVYSMPPPKGVTKLMTSNAMRFVPGDRVVLRSHPEHDVGTVQEYSALRPRTVRVLWDAVKDREFSDVTSHSIQELVHAE